MNTETAPKYILPDSHNTRSIDIVCLGSFVIERVFNLSAQIGTGQDHIDINSITDTYGGCATTVSCIAARLGATTSLITKTGDDKGCLSALEDLERSGVSLEHVIQYTSQPGTIIRLLTDPQGSWNALGSVNTNLELTIDHIPQVEYFSNVKILHIDGYSFIGGKQNQELVQEAIRRALLHNCIISIDACVPAAKHHTTTLVDIFSRSHIIFANLEEAQMITGKSNIEDIIISYRSFKPHFGVIKNGKHGSHIITSKAHAHIPSIRANFKDSIGAGDAYVAAMLYSLTSQYSLMDSALNATASGSLACEGYGSLSNYYTVQDIQHKLNTL
ncbi:MAG: hypothetical protein CMQ51_00780 [Gammaproteobacteria bacterium]|nr:hypothetical protein [Gammaproteobacteria bacterium]